MILTAAPLRNFPGFERDRRFLRGFLAFQRLALLVAELEIEGHITEPHAEPAAQGNRDVALAIELDAVGGAQIPQFITAVHPPHLGVRDRDGAAVDHDVIVTAAPEGHHPAVELETIGLRAGAGDGDGDSGHGFETGFQRAF
jgi:hypothetical protein